ncbi:T9SS type A sorting domain-containing protein [bacterium]|nr:T9SS type A sorting domain-containing protein [bacterium]
MKQKILLVITVLLLTASITMAQIATAPRVGDGSVGNPYQITNIDNLTWLSQADSSWGSNFIQTAHIDASETSTWDGGAGFSPIGNETTQFTGSYNGQGYVIDSLTINRPSTILIGLFGITEGARINSVGMTSCYILGNNYVGGLVGYSNATSIVSSYSTGSVSGNDFIGGLVGDNLLNSTVSSCYSTGSVSGNDYIGGLVGSNNPVSIVSNCYSTGSVSGNDFIGGLVGSNAFSSTVSNCYCTGYVSGTDGVGGLVGSNIANSIVQKSYYNSETAGQIDTAKGGALTTSQMKLSSFFNAWDFTQTWEIDNGETFPRLKNIANIPIILHTLNKRIPLNEVYNDAIQVVGMDNQTIRIELLQFPEGMSLFNDSIITWTPTEVGNYTVIVAAIDANGLLNTYIHTIFVEFNGEGTAFNPYEIATLNDLKVLSETSSIWNSYFIQTAHIEASACRKWNSGEGFLPIGNETTKFTGSYNGQGYIINGLSINRPSTNYIGLFGYTNGATIYNMGVTSCAITGRSYVGGLVGYNYSNSTVSNCYSTGAFSGTDDVGGLVGYNTNSSTVSNCYSAGSVSGIDNVGGFVGYNTNSSTVSNCYSVGSVSGTDCIGGLVGRNSSNSNVSFSYYNSEIAEQIETANGDALSTSQMKQSSYFDTWDFSLIWEITDGVNFPRLKNIGDSPIILHTLRKNNKPNVVYKETIQVVGMDSQTISIELLEGPESMVLVNDSIILWTPTEVGDYIVKVAATDANGLQNIYCYTISVINFNGEGTKSNPYKIASLDDLKLLSEISSIWDSCFIQTAHIDASVTITWNSGAGFSPIGNETTKFTGSYNGQGYNINGLMINRPSTNYIGFFGCTYGAIINSMRMNSCCILGNNYVGGLVGCNNSSSIVSDCYSIGSVSGVDGTGGLVGYNNSSSTVSDCYSTGTVSGTDDVGGLVGYNTSSSIVSSCYSTGSVSGVIGVGGLVGHNTSSSIVSNCYSTGSVSGVNGVGGLVGYNDSYSTVSNCYSTGAVCGTAVGGLVGSNYYSTVSNSFFSSETSGQIIGINSDITSPSQTVIALTTTKMKQSVNFDKYDFTAIWRINEDHTYPALLSINNNAPFAFADKLNVASGSSLLANDYDYETGQNFLTSKIISVSTKGSISNGIYSFNTNTAAGTIDTVTYCVGELMANGDTLWGNNAVAILTKTTNFSAPILSAVSGKTIDEDIPLTISLNDVTANDAENDALLFVVSTGDHYSVNGNTITPAADFYGSLTIPVAVSDGELNSDTLSMRVVVNAINDAPVITSVKDTTISENNSVTLSLEDVTVNDVEGDNLYLIVYPGDNYTVNGLVVTCDVGFNDTLIVPVAVFDGALLSDTKYLTITVSPVTGLTEQSISSITVYPNPTATSINVEGSKAIVSIYNLAGNKLITHDLSQSKNINISQLPNGIYLLRVEGRSIKVVKE